MAKSESTKIEFGYFHDYESEQFAFYRIPKVLFTDEYFRNLSSDAKVLYGLMLDRMALSIRHQWFDEEGNIGWVWSMVLPDGEQKKIYDHMLILNLKIILFSQKQRVLLCQADQRIRNTPGIKTFW